MSINLITGLELNVNDAFKRYFLFIYLYREIAKEQGFHYVRADCSSLFSGKLCERIGFDMIYKLNYNDYVDEEGKPIFSPSSPHTAVVSYIKKL